VANPCAQILSPQTDKSTENEGKGVIDASGEERVHPVGHDWGATVAWGVAAEIVAAEIAVPTGHKTSPHYRRVRTDTIDAAGVITLRYNSTVRCHWISVRGRRLLEVQRQNCSPWSRSVITENGGIRDERR
jgi:hypothetical protein